MESGFQPEVGRAPDRRVDAAPHLRALIRLQPPALAFEPLVIGRASVGHSARADELDDPPQFLALEPDTVGSADVHDDPRARGEVDALHQLAAGGAWEIAPGF